MSLRGPFRFDRARHLYTVGTRIVPACGTIVKWARQSSDGPWMKEEHRARGTAVHAATLALDLGDDEASVLARMPAEWRPFLSAYCDFRRSCALHWRQLEEPMVHRALMFAGTPDRLGTLNRYPAILEIKTGGATDWHGLQTAGQDILVNPKFGTMLRRYVVYLSKEGRYKLREHTDSGDYLQFLHALTAYHTAAAQGGVV